MFTRTTTRYVCEICGEDYSCQDQAETCEAKGILPQPFQAGDLVTIHPRYSLPVKTKVTLIEQYKHGWKYEVEGMYEMTKDGDETNTFYIETLKD